jgi:hypothetical protein
MVRSPLSRRKTGRGQLALQDAERGPHHVRLGALRAEDRRARLLYAVVIAEPPDELRQRIAGVVAAHLKE